jgi:hypothetical protein
MAGYESIDRNLQAEDDLVRRHNQQCEAELCDGEVPDDPGGDEMKITAAGDVHYNEAPKQEAKKSNWMATAALGAALLASGAGAGALVPLAIGAMGDKHETTDTDTRTRISLTPLEPEGTK